MHITILMIPLLFLTGCWDEVEIEQRGFVFGIAIDMADEETSSNSIVELTSQLIVPENLSSASGGGGSGTAFRNLTKTGETVFSANREMFKETSRVIDVTHLSIILISDDFVSQPNLFKESIDVFLRERDMRRGILIAITSGKAKELLSIEPEHDKIPTKYISQLVENKGYLEVVSNVRIGDIQEKVLQNESFPLPLLKVNDQKTITQDGVAIINGVKSEMVGVLRGDEAKGLSFLRDEKHTGVLNIEVDGKSSTMELIKIKHKITLENNDPNNLEFLYTIDVTASIAEQVGNEDVMKPGVHEKFEIELAKKIEELSKKTVEKLQKDYQTDILDLGAYLDHYYPKLWEQTKDNWEKGEGNFSKSKIRFQTNVNIERPGNINKTSDGSKY